ncbi:hypothetical protein DFJ43DRAFT_1041104 [Lentinula guzmanii]|uniref:Uncharacterized protein n=1 Tax=Lentinula guzmanii TaxID=2804957 RepID=A0AA38J851_9AGAR|nr:hypothetical protein DFJ43DRAFT_1041104 [Lentinula guzmanii]
MVLDEFKDDDAEIDVSERGVVLVEADADADDGGRDRGSALCPLDLAMTDRDDAEQQTLRKERNDERARQGGSFETYEDQKEMAEEEEEEEKRQMFQAVPRTRAVCPKDVNGAPEVKTLFEVVEGAVLRVRLLPVSEGESIDRRCPRPDPGHHQRHHFVVVTIFRQYPQGIIETRYWDDARKDRINDILRKARDKTDGSANAALGIEIWADNDVMSSNTRYNAQPFDF